jgi:hypothetical protein
MAHRLAFAERARFEQHPPLGVEEREAATARQHAVGSSFAIALVGGGQHAGRHPRHPIGLTPAREAIRHADVTVFFDIGIPLPLHRPCGKYPQQARTPRVTQVHQGDGVVLL